MIFTEIEVVNATLYWRDFPARGNVARQYDSRPQWREYSQL